MSFSVFNFHGSILHTPKSVGQTNQSSGAWVPGPAAVSVPITGDIQDLTYRDLQRLPEGEYTIGDARIFTAAVLDPDDTLQVTEGDGTVSSWQVKTLEKTGRMMAAVCGIRRRSYLLKRQA
ncbi:MAG: hypothetical protein LUQ71_10310 [Methanoregula sp.]|nr:hypothetical protein [Methanoregula sp.]